MGCRFLLIFILDGSRRLRTWSSAVNQYPNSLFEKYPPGLDGFVEYVLQQDPRGKLSTCTRIGTEQSIEVIQFKREEDTVGVCHSDEPIINVVSQF